MPLTRAEWLDMWKDIKKIEESYEVLRMRIDISVPDEIHEAVRAIKDRIQQVIGQME